MADTTTLSCSSGCFQSENTHPGVGAATVAAEIRRSPRARLRWRRGRTATAGPRLHLAADAAGDGLWEWDIAGGALWYSPGLQTMLGVTPGEVPATVEFRRSRIHPDDLPAVEAALAAHLSGDHPRYECEYRVRTGSGGWLWIRDRGRVVAWDVERRPARMIGSQIDVTARKRMEEELRLSEERLQGIIGLAQDAILTTDADLNITLFNRAAESLFGYDADDILGRPLSLLIPERFRADHDVHIANFSASGLQARVMTNRREVQGLTADGREFPAEVSIAKLHHAHGLLFTAVIRDVSERKRVESELRRMATTDPLTGLNNRRRFLELAEVEMARLRRYGRPVSVLMLDIDRFKAINDSHGHATGDRALVRLAEVCRSELRDTDHIGRLSGEEFAIILPETPLASAGEVAERLRHRLALADVPLNDLPLDPADLGQGCIRMTVSIDVAMSGEDDACIERALYEAKAAGRNRVVIDDGYPGPASVPTSSVPTSIAS